jgi:hypothetical protein
MSKSPPPDPVCKAILLCQKSIVEEGTGLVSLVSVFNGFGVGENGLSGAAEAFCRITEAVGKYRITVEIQDLSTGTAIAGADAGEIEINDPLLSGDVIIPIPSIPFPHPGQYDFVVFANGTEIDRQKFSVRRMS